jgi:hypothetical protein
MHPTNLRGGDVFGAFQAQEMIVSNDRLLNVPLGSQCRTDDGGRQ